MRFVPLKTMEQLDLQAIHRLRTRLVARRTAVINQMRGFLLERGVTVPIGRQALVERFPEVLGNPAFGVAVKAIYDCLKHLKDGGAIEDLADKQASSNLLRSVDRTEEFVRWQEAFLRS